MDRVVVMLDDTDHPETYCEVSIAGQLSLRVSEHEGARIAELLICADPRIGSFNLTEITGIAGEKHCYQRAMIYGVSTSTKAARHAATLRGLQEEDEEKETKRLAGRTFDE